MHRGSLLWHHQQRRAREAAARARGAAPDPGSTPGAVGTASAAAPAASDDAPAVTTNATGGIVDAPPDETLPAPADPKRRRARQGA